MSDLSQNATLPANRSSIVRGKGSTGNLVLLFECGREVVARMLPPNRRITVGRASGADVVLPDETLSRVHASFSRSGDSLWVEDLGSTNGVFVGNEQIDRSRLRASDVVLLGKNTRARAVWGTVETPQSVGDPILGRASHPVFSEAMVVASSDIRTLILGETGTGKEVLARFIHDRSSRHEMPILTINCGAIPDTLIESALFGHVRGAFTGADRDQSGAFEEANGGTLFLDEIGELSPRAQATLLRVLESGTYHRVGSAEQMQIDVRIMAATHRDLRAMCDAGDFRLDLYFRVAGTTLVLPPLRQRVDEIESLTMASIAEANQRHGRSVTGIDPRALDELRARPWPGNIRELKNVVERAVVVAGGGVVVSEDLGEPILSSPAPRASTQPPPMTLEEALRGRELELMVGALRVAQGNVAEAARQLGIPRRTLAHKMQQMSAMQYVYDAGFAAPGAPSFPLQLRDELAREERARIEHAISSTSGPDEAAQLLGISRRSLDRRMGSRG